MQYQLLYKKTSTCIDFSLAGKKTIRPNNKRHIVTECDTYAPKKMKVGLGSLTVK